MAQDIVSGLFGMSPWQAEQAQNKRVLDFAATSANLAPKGFEQAALFLGQGAGNLMKPVAGMMGMVNPEVEQAKMTEAAMSGLDINDPQAIVQRAQQIQDPRLKMKLMMLAQQKSAEIRKAQAESASAYKDLALADKALRENPNLKEVTVGVKGKPGWKQVMLFDKSNPSAPAIPIGEPMMSDAAIRVSVGGGGQKESIQPIPYIDPATGKAMWGTIADARGKPAAAYDPVTKQLLATATEVGKGQGEAFTNLPKQENALDAVKDALKTLESGIYTGFWGPTQRTAVAATPFVDKKKVGNTDTFIAQIGETVIPRLKEFGGNDSNQELQFLQKISGGDISMQPGSIKKVLESAERKINRGILRVKRGFNPDGTPKTKESPSSSDASLPPGFVEDKP